MYSSDLSRIDVSKYLIKQPGEELTEEERKKKPKKFYNIEPLLKHESLYNLLLGERSNGKSFQVKWFSLACVYMSPMRKLIYLRRYDLDCKPSSVESYFGDMVGNKNIVQLVTQGTYDGVLARRGKLYFAKYSEEDDKLHPEIEIGYYCGLSIAEHYKSLTFPGVENIIYEEFISNQGELPNEPELLQNFVSTVARNRNVRVFMIANNITRVSSYFKEWDLHNLSKQKIGTIDDYYYHRNVDGEDIVTKISVERCESVNNKSAMSFGRTSKSISGGEFETFDLPRIPKCRHETIYEIEFKEFSMDFVIQLKVDIDTGGTFVFVYPLTNGRKIRRIIQREFSTDPFITTCLKDTKIEQMIAKLIKEQKICYSDNLTGTDFLYCLQSRAKEGLKL